MPSVIMLNVTYKPYMLSVFILNVVMLSVVSPFSEVSMLMKITMKKFLKIFVKIQKWEK